MENAKSFHDSTLVFAFVFAYIASALYAITYLKYAKRKTRLTGRLASDIAEALDNAR